ncbi:hypothetical protein LCGC14_0722930 [marine sediment metagenome]|uniref:Uncharacterized protein n=1 Tax=marine sediment metagenome TaxID=412755 RepID=A0A0F9QG22_9ZZZZ
MTTEKKARDVQYGAVLLATEAVKDEETKIVALVSTAEALTIKTTEELGASTDLLQTVKSRQKALTDMRLSITRPMDAAKKRVMELFQPAVDRLATAEQTIKTAVLAYTQEQVRLQREAQDRLDAEAERERVRLATLAEKQRVAGRTTAPRRPRSASPSCRLRPLRRRRHQPEPFISARPGTPR